MLYEESWRKKSLEEKVRRKHIEEKKIAYKL